MTTGRLAELLAALPGARPLIVGDAMLDEYLWGSAGRVSQEAPVLVVRCHRTTHIPGGAANVLHCFQALGARAGLLAVIGRDRQAEDLLGLLAQLGAEPLCLLEDPDRETTVKTRVVAHRQQVLRLDRESTQPLGPAIAERLYGALETLLDQCDSVLLSDYDKGVLNDQTIPRLLAAAAARGVPVSVNAKPRCAELYRGVDLLTVNRVEASAVAGIEVEDVETGRAAAAAIADRLGCRLVLVTLGPDGAVFCAGGQAPEAVGAVPVAVADPSGAGDTTIAAAHLALCRGAEPREAVELAMLAAGVVVRKLGVATASREEIAALAGEPRPDQAV